MANKYFGRENPIGKVVTIDNQFDFKIYPNPNEGHFSIELENTGTQNLNINLKIIDLMGKVILDKDYNLREGINEFRIIDFMPRYHTSENEYYSPPDIIRYIKYKSGKPSFRINYNPRLEYAKYSTKTEVKKDPLPMHYKIFIKDGEQCHFIPLSDIRLIQSMDNYARLFFNEEKAMIKRSLNLLQEKLDPAIFFRINRSQIINTHYIKEIHPYFNNKLQIIMTSGEKLEVSSRQSAKFKNWNSL